ncbi:hypothetical protein OIO90_003672 [Microbotryomycetes sp. JL221]|nr:hypothetical protein OIO90_003672 [Microbotryomycetes sp. JL221]
MPTVFDQSIGCFVIGTFLTLFLGGITTLQAIAYFNTPQAQNDKLTIKALVSSLLVLDTFHSACCCHTVYYYAVTNFANPQALIGAPWTFGVDPCLVGTIASACQVFFAYRVWIISKKCTLPIIILTLSAIQLGFSFGATGIIFKFNDFGRAQEWAYGIMIWLVTAALNISITVSLTYYLRKAAEGTFQRSQTLVNRIALNTFETNGLTLAIALLDAALFIAWPNVAWHVIPNFMLPKLYFNSVLVSLNSRQALSLLHATVHPVATATLDRRWTISRPTARSGSDEVLDMQQSHMAAEAA